MRLKTESVKQVMHESVYPLNHSNPLNQAVTKSDILGLMGFRPNSGQPQIDPYYFWSFLAVVDGKIPGHFPFVLNGGVKVVDGGLYFDGSSGFLSAQLVTSNILLNPDQATRGLALGISLKFDGTSKDYDIPKYVLDTEAQSGGKTGLSLYVLNGKMVAEIAASNMKWKVWGMLF